MPVYSKFQAVTQQGDTVGASSIAEQLSDLGLSVRSAPPAALTTTVTPLWNRIAVQVDGDPAGVVTGTTLEGFVDYRTPAGKWRRGTVLLKRYDADEYYGNCFNLREATAYTIRVTLRLRDGNGAMVREFVQSFTTTTLSAATPQINETKYYVDPSVESAGNGLTPSTPFKWLDDRSWQPGDTIVIMNGDFSGASTTAERRIDRVTGTADNWVRVIPYEPAGETARIQSPVTLNGPWTDETVTYDNTWSMDVGTKLIGVVRDEDTGYEIQPHQYLTNASASDPGLAQGNVDGHASWFLDYDAGGNNKLYIRTADGLEPPNDKFIGGYYTGLTVTGCQYLCLDGLKFGLSQNVTNADVPQPGTARGLVINTLATAGYTTTDMVILRNCDFQNAQLDIQLGSGNPTRRILLDNCNIERNGIYETLYERVEYTEADPYDDDYGYGITKSSLWDRAGIYIETSGEVAIRDITMRGFNGVVVENNVTYGKNLDVYDSTFDRHLQVAMNWSGDSGASGCINAACYNCRLDHGAWAIAISPMNDGPIWFFANYGDGILHNPYKIGIQGPGSGYDTEDGHGFKVVANNSFAIAGHATSETIGVPFRFQGGHSGCLGYNDVIKGYQSTEASPTGHWFAYFDEVSTNLSVPADRLNVWKNGIIYVVNKSGDTTKPQQRWHQDTYDVIGGTNPRADEMVWQDYLIGWSGNPSPGEADTDPFPVSVADGLSESVTRKSVAVRGITDLAGDESGNPLGSAALPVGRFPLRNAE